MEEAENTLKEVRAEEDRTATRHRTTASPGHTPKSSVQHNLARLGMINSPDRKGLASILEEFMEQLVDGKTLGLEEEDIRKQMAAQYGMTLVDLTKQLFEQATEEQRKGTKGLTKFLAKWRKQAAARESSSSDSWCVVTPSQSPGASTAPRSETATPESVKEEVPRSRKPPGLVTLAPPGIYDPDRKAGTGEEQQPQSEMVGIAKAIQQQTNELASLVKAQQESTMAPGGSVKSLGRTSEELVYLLRACEQYTVQVGGGEYGAALASALLAAQAGASTKLRNAGFRQKVTTRLAVGLAGPHWGTQEKYALSAADFTPSTDAELDQFAIESRTGKVLTEQRPAAPTRYEDWISRVRRQNDIWALVYGAEWKNVKDHAANLLSEWHLGAPHRWPLQVLCDVWEELHWRFIEELKEELRKIKKLAGRESMTLQDLKFYALMPNEQGEPPLQLPRTFDLKNPDGWFMTEVLPRIERRQERMLWKMTWEGAGKNRSQGQSAGGDGGAPKGEKTGLSLKNLFGPKLTPEETNKAKDRAPTNKDGKLLCWGFLTHLGCNQTNCQRAHEQLKGTFEALDPAVQMQLLRRGGLKRMRPETKDSVVEKIKALRNQVSQDRTSKVQDGKDRRRAGQEGERETQESSPEKAGGHRVHWEAPEEMRNVDFTAQEQEFAEMVRGPDENIFQHVEREALPHPGRGGESGPWEAQELIRKAQQLADGPVLGALKEASDDLYAWAATRVANDPAVGLQELLEEMNQFDLGELAAEAAAILDKQDGGEKAGHAGRCQVGESTWDSSGVGRALVHVDGTAWAMWDFGEMVEMTEELAGLLGVLEAEPEKRQCVTKVLAAGSLWAKTSKVPSMEEVEITAKQFRLEQARLAADAEGVMGHPEAKVAPVEHELRMYSHDILKAHHDKDYRALAVFPLNDLDHLRLVVLRVDYKGDLLVETVTGSQWTEQQPDVWALICRGHMTLLVPPDPAEARKLILKEEAYNTPSFGFRYFWHQRHDQPRTSPGILACRLCKPGRKGGSKEPYGMVRKTSCLPALARVLAGSPQPARPVPPAAGRQGLVLREYFAGHGVITKGWQEAGLTALEPVELYQDPHQQLGPRQEHDLSVKENQSKYLQGIQQDETNVEWIAAPCTTFCDWALQNGGTRTFDKPEGLPTPKEHQGNVLSAFGAQAFEAAMQRGHFPIAESSGPSGRYPKQWNLPCWRRILQLPNVTFLEIDMCAFGLGPPDQPGCFYRHRTGLAFPHHPPLRQALLRLCPGISATHTHVPLKGSRPGATVSRCTEAGVYAPNFVLAVVETLVETLVVRGGVSSPQPAPRVRAGGGACEVGEDRIVREMAYGTFPKSQGHLVIAEEELNLKMDQIYLQDYLDKAAHMTAEPEETFELGQSYGQDKLTREIEVDRRNASRNVDRGGRSRRKSQSSGRVNPERWATIEKRRNLMARLVGCGLNRKGRRNSRRSHVGRRKIASTANGGKSRIVWSPNGRSQARKRRRNQQ